MVSHVGKGGRRSFSRKPKALQLTIPVFWLYIVGVLIFTVFIGVLTLSAVNYYFYGTAVEPTVTATSEAVVAQRYRDIITIDMHALREDIGEMSHACDPLATEQSTCLYELSLVHSWLIQFRSDLDSAWVPRCYFFINGQIQDDITSYLGAEEVVYRGESLQQPGSMAQGLAMFKRTTAKLDDTLVTEGSIKC